MALALKDGIMKDERVIYEAKVSWATLIRHFFLMLILIGFLTILFQIIKNLTTVLSFTNKRLIGRTGLVSTSAMDSPLNKIQNVAVNAGIMGKIFGYGTITVNTAAGNYVFPGISRPNEFRTTLVNQMEEYENDRVQKQAVEMARAMKNS